jgi:hypothetical protein
MEDADAVEAVEAGEYVTGEVNTAEDIFLLMLDCFLAAGEECVEWAFFILLALIELPASRPPSCSSL